MAWAQPGSVLRQSRSTRPSWSVPSSSMSRCVLAVLVKELMPESIVKFFFECWNDARADISFVSFLFNDELQEGNTPSWRPGSMKLQELRELRHDWAKEQMSRVFLAKLTRKMLKQWMFYKSVWKLILQFGWFMCENPPKKCHLISQKKNRRCIEIL